MSSLRRQTTAESLQINMKASKKREAPEDLRTAFLKKQKQLATSWVSIDIPASTAERLSLQKLTLPSSLDDMETTISIIKRRNGEYLPKIHLKNDSRKKNIEFLLPKMVVKYQDLGKEGNLGRFTQDLNKAKFTVSLETGCPAEIDSMLPGLVKQQESFFERLRSECNNHMKKVYEEDEWLKTRGEKTLEEFVGGANMSCLKMAKDDNDDVYEVISLSRRLTDFQGGPNNPTFWKVDENNEFKVIEPKFIPRGSVIQCTGSLRAYNVSPDMYGVSMDLGRDIIVVWIPPKEKPVEQKKSVPDVPYINFDF